MAAEQTREREKEEEEKEEKEKKKTRRHQDTTLGTTRAETRAWGGPGCPVHTVPDHVSGGTHIHTYIRTPMMLSSRLFRKQAGEAEATATRPRPNTPRNWYYILTVIVIGCGTIPKGYDEGGFSAATSLASFKDAYNLNDFQWLHDPDGLASKKADVTSLGVLGAVFGSLLALAMTDRIGRLRSFQVLVLLYMSGYLMQIFASGNYGLLLFARVWGGLGAGGLTVVGPLYLSEISPAKSRGMIVSISMVFLLSFLSLGMHHNQPSYRVPILSNHVYSSRYHDQVSSSTTPPAPPCRPNASNTAW